MAMAAFLRQLLPTEEGYHRMLAQDNLERARRGLPPRAPYPVVPPDETEATLAWIEEEARRRSAFAPTAFFFLRLLDLLRVLHALAALAARVCQWWHLQLQRLPWYCSMAR